MESDSVMALNDGARGFQASAQLPFVVVGLVLLGALLGCDSSDAPSGRASVHLPDWVRPGLCENVRTDLERVLRVGGADADGNGGPQFGSVAAATLLPGNGMAVADGITKVISFFDNSGELVGTSGGEGSGPGEFREIGFLDSRGPEVVAYDRLLRRVTVLNSQGDLVETYSLAAEAGGPAALAAMTADREALLVRPRSPSGGRGAFYRDSIEVLQVSFDRGVVSLLGRYPGTERVYGISGAFSVRRAPFGRRATVGVTGGIAMVATGDTPEVRLINLQSGQSIRVTVPDLSFPVEPERISEYLDFEEGDVGVEESFRREFENVPLPDRSPPYGEVLPDRTGLLWVSGYASPHAQTVRVSVVSPRGRVLEELELPQGTTVLDADTERVLLRFVDGWGRPEVRVHRRECLGGA